MRSIVEETVAPIMKLIDEFGQEWWLEQRPLFYPNMQIHQLIYSNKEGRRKNVRFDWDGRVIGGDGKLGDLILAKF